MSVTGPDGIEWVTVAECLDRVPGLNGNTVRSWLRARPPAAVPVVRSVRVGRCVWVVWQDVLEREVAAHLAGWKRGRHAASPGLVDAGAG